MNVRTRSTLLRRRQVLGRAWTGDREGRRAVADWLPERASRLRAGLVYAIQDSLIAATSFATVLLLRYGGNVPADRWHSYLTFLPLAATVFVGLYAAAGLYGRIWRYASIAEARRLLAAGTVAMLVLYAVDEVSGRPLPRAVVLAGSVFTTMLVGTTRFQSRLFAFRRRTEQGSTSGVVVLGAGDTGASLVRQMLEAPRRQWTPLALLDDAASLRGRTVHGVTVLGRFDDLPEVARRAGAQVALLAVATADRILVRRVTELAEQAGVALQVLPAEGADHLVGPPSLSAVRKVAIEDLLGREQVRTDMHSVSALVAGRRVLVTGGGGSIGSEIVRQVLALGPACLVVLDHDETHLHDTLASLPLSEAEAPVVELADIRDYQLVRRVFARHHPDVVFHAAAHKHVPLLEDHPCEAVLTNVVGTQHVVDAATEVGTSVLVLISTDKAVRPSSVMGASKRVAEMVVTQAAQDTGRPWCAVRFGNVLGSRGSVVPTFVRQIETGGPVTVTHPRMTRYFMSIPEAVQLVLQAAALSRGGDLFMLDMGDPVRIMDLAKRMVHLSGRRLGEDVELRVIGIRPGEKLHEQLRSPEERDEPTEHPAVLRLHPLLPTRDSVERGLAALGRAQASHDGAGCCRELKRLVSLADYEVPQVPRQAAANRETVWSPSTI